MCQIFGLTGAGIAFFGSYIFHGILTYPIARVLSGFRWSAANWQTGLIFLSLIATVFCSFYMLPLHLRPSGALALIGSVLYSVRVLFKLVPLAHLPRPSAAADRWIWLHASPHETGGRCQGRSTAN